MRKTNCLKDLISGKSKTIIGLNSGTSADGIDAAVIRVSGNGFKSKVEFIRGATYKHSLKLKSRILKYAQPEFRDGVNWLKLDIELAEMFAKACLKVIKKARLRVADIDMIGSHGQTIRHLPAADSQSLSYQLGDPARIAAFTGITTIGDFRIADIASGGQGAPLTPIVNAILFGESRRSVGVLNIGGIANISAISYSDGKYRLFGCDTGPGNMLIDWLSDRLFNREYDSNGKIAATGYVDKTLASSMLKAKYYNIKGPKSSGREQYGARFAETFLHKAKARGLKKEDIIATASYLTSKAVRKCVKLNGLKLDLLITTGGGTKNRFLMRTLEELLPDIEFRQATEYGFPNDYLEAVSFAILANETLCSNRYDLKKVTGSRQEIVLGKICQA